MSYVEPTSAALLALKTQPNAGGNRDTAILKARDFLISLEHPDGGWGIGAIDSEGGWMTAWAVWALVGVEVDAAPFDVLPHHLVRAGNRFPGPVP